MTDHEAVTKDNNARIAALEAQLSEMRTQVSDLHQQFLEPSPTGEPPLAQRLIKTVIAFERGSWLAKFTVWAILGASSLAGAIKVLTGFHGGGSQ